MVQLGDEVEDSMTGFRGIAISRHIFLHGSTSITVQPVVENYGYLPESEIFYEAALRVVKTKKEKKPVTVLKEV